MVVLSLRFLPCPSQSVQPCQEWRAAKSLCQRLQPRLKRLLQQLDRSHFTPSRALYPACLTQCSWPLATQATAT
jgi:hypothetical protein